jgi:hypothetical protein
VAVESVSEELERAAAQCALEIMFDNIVGPLRIEEVFQKARALGQEEDAVTHEIQEMTREPKILPGLVEAHAIHEILALWA